MYLRSIFMKPETLILSGSAWISSRVPRNTLQRLGLLSRAAYYASTHCECQIFEATFYASVIILELTV
jgi:hypothetical protein